MPSEKKDIESKVSKDNGEKNPQLSTGSKNTKYEETNFVDITKPVWNYSLLTDDDVINYQNGTNYQLYKKIRFSPYTGK